MREYPRRAAYADEYRVDSRSGNAVHCPWATQSNLDRESADDLVPRMDEEIQVRLGQKDRLVDVTACSSAATAFEDERDGQGGFATPSRRIETL